MSGQVVTADLVWTGRRFEPDVALRVDEAGRIAAIGSDAAGTAAEPTRRLARRALLPGFVNAHSHAFQRGLRGRGETFPEGAGSFWTWRDAMYELVSTLDEERFYELCLQAFREMLACGMTAVGEFHYLHHAGESRDFALDAVVLAAAADAGIRLALLEVYYATGAIGRPLAGSQRRFACASVDEYWRQLDRLQGLLDPRTQSLGVVAHSIRAATLDDVAALYAGACERGLPFHMHVEEQRQEVASAVEAYGRRPMGLLNARLAISPRFTAIHCTHTEPADLARFLKAGGRVCLCPLTEANLGDGIADLPAILAAGGEICLGSDTNDRIAMTEEMRWLEYVQRLARERRGVGLDGEGVVGRRLLEASTAGGAAALGIAAGAIEAGRWADFVALDLDAPSLRGADADSLLDAFVFGGRDDAVAEVCVGGRWLGA
jgi:formimidoylglutamate deiminase